MREELPGDELAVSEVIRAAFALEPDSTGTEHFVVDALRRDAVLDVSLVATAEGGIIGHIAVSRVSITPHDDPGADGPDGWYGLGPVSVLPDFQRQGVGTQLIRKALDELSTAQGCVLDGDPDFYRRFGFAPDDRLTHSYAKEGWFQVLPIQCPPEEVPVGSVEYHAYFDVSA